MSGPGVTAVRTEVKGLNGRNKPTMKGRKGRNDCPSFRVSLVINSQSSQTSSTMNDPKDPIDQDSGISSRLRIYLITQRSRLTWG